MRRSEYKKDNLSESQSRNSDHRPMHLGIALKGVENEEIEKMGK